MLKCSRRSAIVLRDCVLALLIVILASGSVVPQQKTTTPGTRRKPRVVGILFAVSSGMCYGYCSYELNVEPDTAVLLVSSQGEDSRQCPNLKVTADLSGKHWNELAGSIDRESLLGLPPKIGCPGCVDEPVESIEVRFSDHVKKEIYYNAGGAPNEIAALSQSLYALKEKLAKELPPTYLKRCNK